MIEAELKARLVDADAVRAALGRRAQPQEAVYFDTYYDTRGGDLDHAGRELRLRTIRTAHDTQHLLTFKEPAVDEASGSKPEFETAVATRGAVAHMLEALGYGPAVDVTKECTNYRFSDGGRDFLATVVRVPEIDGTFLEIETIVDEPHVDAALAAARSLMAGLGVTEGELTTQLYTDAVRAARS